MHSNGVVGSRAHHAARCHWLPDIVRCFRMCACRVSIYILAHFAVTQSKYNRGPI